MKNIKIYGVMTVVMLFWGFNVSAIKILVENFPPITITALRIFTSGMIIIGILTATKKIRKPSLKEWKYIFLGSILGIVGHHYYLSMGLLNTTATNGGLILGLGPLLTALFSMLLLRRFPTSLQILGLLSGSVGVFFIILSGGKGISNISIGDLFVFLAIVAQALSFIFISRGTQTLQPIVYTGYMLITGSVLLFVISQFQEPGGIETLFQAPLMAWMTFLLSAIFATALGQTIYNFTIHKIGPSETAIFLNLTPFFALVGSATVLGEVIKLHHLLGLLFIVIGVLCGSGAIEELIQKRRRVKMQEHLKY